MNSSELAKSIGTKNIPEISFTNKIGMITTPETQRRVEKMVSDLNMIEDLSKFISQGCLPLRIFFFQLIL